MFTLWSQGAFQGVSQGSRELTEFKGFLGSFREVHESLRLVLRGSRVSLWHFKGLRGVQGGLGRVPEGLTEVSGGFSDWQEIT